MLLAATTEGHGLIWSSVALDATAPFLALTVGHGVWFWIHTAYSYVLLLLGTLLLLAVGAFVLWRGERERLRRGVGWFVVGTFVALIPLALFYLQNPDLLLGRTGQVSILNPAINGGDLWGTLWRQTGQALGLFIWRGDTILRHNPAGRPLFDWLMAGPFVLGVVWCLRHWRQPAAATVLLWSSLMLGVTILAEDTPHFLRAVGILPAAVFLPALGLAWLLKWPRLPKMLGSGLVALLVAGSLLLTVRDYVNYSQQPDTALHLLPRKTGFGIMQLRQAERRGRFIDQGRRHFARLQGQANAQKHQQQYKADQRDGKTVHACTCVFMALF